MVEYGADRQVRVLLQANFAETGKKSHVLLNLLGLEQFDVPAERAAKDLDAFLAHLLENDLIEP